MDQHVTADSDFAHTRSGSPTVESNFEASLVARLKPLLERQAALADAREALLVERSSFRSHGTRVHAQRVRTGDAEVKFMNALREFCNEHGLSLPPVLVSAYNTVQQERDKLGSLESDYSLREESLAGMEWEFLEEENDFYQYNLEDTISKEIPNTPSKTEEHEPSQCSQSATFSSALLEYQATVTNHRQLIAQFNALRPAQVEVLDNSPRHYQDTLDIQPDGSENSGFEKGYMDLLDKCMESEVRLRHLRQDIMLWTIPAPLILFPERELVNGGQESVQIWSEQQPVRRNARILLDGEPPDSMRGLPKCDRTSEWLLSRLKGGALERLMFFNILQSELKQLKITASNYNFWERLAAGFWLCDATDELRKWEKKSQDDAIQHSQLLPSNVSSQREKPESPRSTPISDEDDSRQVCEDILAGIWPSSNAARHADPIGAINKQLPPPEIYVRDVHGNIDAPLISRVGQPPSPEDDQKGNEVFKVGKTCSPKLRVALETEGGLDPNIPKLHQVENPSDENLASNEDCTITSEQCSPPEHTPSGRVGTASSLGYDGCEKSDIKESERHIPLSADEATVCSKKRMANGDGGLTTYDTAHDCLDVMSLTPETIKDLECAIEEAETSLFTSTTLEHVTRNNPGWTSFIKPREGQTTGRGMEIGLSPNLQGRPPSRARSVSERSNRYGKSDLEQLSIPPRPRHTRSKSANSIFTRAGLWHKSYIYI